MYIQFLVIPDGNTLNVTFEQHTWNITKPYLDNNYIQPNMNQVTLCLQKHTSANHVQVFHPWLSNGDFLMCTSTHFFYLYLSLTLKMQQCMTAI